MIDWIKAVIPFTHSEQLHNGSVISLTRNGDVEWATNKRLPVLGSYDASLHLQSELSSRSSTTGLYTHIVFDGNPAKFFQGHNLWGTDDLVGLMVETVIRVCSILRIAPAAEDWERIVNGHYQLKRVDSTMMIDLKTSKDVQAFLYSAERTAHMRYKGQGIMTKGTLYFGKHSRRESLKMYAKGPEIRAKGHELPKELGLLPELYKWADSKLRLEACTRSMQLKDLGLQLACNWGDLTPQNTLYRLLNGLNMSENHTLTQANLEGLPPRLMAVYHLWKEGHDIKKMYPATTFKRYRKTMIEHGIDIAVKQGNRPEPNPNVIEFRRVLRPERCDQIPAWAYGTALMFEPRVNYPSYEELFSSVA
jgi:II/X family phage/plasmid replication protein